MTERQFQMRRLATGDYLLPANTVKQSGRFYRIRKWVDGPHLGAGENRVRWCLLVGYEHELDGLSLRLSPWDMPEWTDLGDFDTRAAAVAAALEHDEAQP